MLKKAMVTVAVAASAAGVSAAAAPQALALGDGAGPAATGADGAPSAFGNGVTSGDASPRAVLERTAPYAMCVGTPSKADVGSLVGLLMPVAVRGPADAPSADRVRSCAENSPPVPGATGGKPGTAVPGAVPAVSGNGADRAGNTR